MRSSARLAHRPSRRRALVASVSLLASLALAGPAGATSYPNPADAAYGVLAQAGGPDQQLTASSWCAPVFTQPGIVGCNSALFAPGFPRPIAIAGTDATLRFAWPVKSLTINVETADWKQITTTPAPETPTQWAVHLAQAPPAGSSITMKVTYEIEGANASFAAPIGALAEVASATRSGRSVRVGVTARWRGTLTVKALGRGGRSLGRTRIRTGPGDVSTAVRLPRGSQATRAQVTFSPDGGHPAIRDVVTLTAR